MKGITNQGKKIQKKKGKMRRGRGKNEEANEMRKVKSGLIGVGFSN